MEELTIYRSGEIDLSSVESLEKDEMKAWIIARLRGRDAIVPGDQRAGEPAYQVFAWVYEESSVETKEKIETAVGEILMDLASLEGTTWRSEEAADLLMLVQHVGGDDHASVIYDAVKTGRFLGERINSSTRYRLLQSLAAMRWEGTVEFWREQLAIDPARYCSVAFLGLLHLRASEAASVLRDLPWDDEVVRGRMSITLRSLKRREDAEKVSREIQDILPSLPPKAQQVVNAAVPDMEGEPPFAPKWFTFIADCREHDPGFERLARSKLFSDLVEVERAGVIFGLLHQGDAPRPKSLKQISRDHNFTLWETRKAEKKGIERARRILRKRAIQEEKAGIRSRQRQEINVMKYLQEIYEGEKKADSASSA